MQNITQKNSCYDSLALAKGNVSYCEQIVTEDFFQFGRMACYVEVAEQTKNTSLCSIYSRYNSAAICVRTIALLKDDSKVCEQDAMEPDKCYYEYAMNKSRVDACYHIAPCRDFCNITGVRTIRQQCFDYFNASSLNDVP